MAKKMLIDATHAEETRVVVVDGNKVDEFDFETVNKRQLAGNIYLAKVTRVEPSLQAAFVDYGGNRHGFLAFSEIHPDYYQIPVADREALLAEEKEMNRDEEEDDAEETKKSRSRSRSRRSRSRKRDRKDETQEAQDSESLADDASEPRSTAIEGMDVVDLGDESVDPDALASPVEVIEDGEEGAAASADAVEVADETPEETVDAAPADENGAETDASTAQEIAPEGEGADEAAAEVAVAETEEENTEAVEVAEAEQSTEAAAEQEAEGVELEAEVADGNETEPTVRPIAARLEDDPADVVSAEAVEGDESDVDAPEAETSGVTEEASAVQEQSAETEEGVAEASETEGDSEAAENEAIDAEADAEAPEAEAEAGDVTAEDSAAQEAAPEAAVEDTQAEAGAEETGSDESLSEAADAADTPREETGSDDEDEDEDHPGHDIESVAEEDVQEEIRRPRKPRMRRYKIQEVIKVRQIMLVQVVKEERGNKGAALTTYLSLAGRYCVLMPNTARGGGISRKITNASDRKKLKEIASEIDVPEGAGLIIRTAGAKRTKAEVKRDYEYLKRLWEQIRELTLKSIAPAPIYEEGNLIKRSIRDLYNREIDEVIVAGDEGYRVAKDFMKMIMPSHAKNVKPYAEPMPLFARYQVESYLAGMFNPVVQLRSGGYIVIGVTEALVAIDVNSGRATKEGSIEDTALKTNLEAAEEVARQLRLRDLAGLIVIDFIDMEERKNNNAVEKRFKDKLKTDRARIQVGRISGFGLMEMSRQRLRPGMLEATTQPCPSCHGTGLLRSDDSIGLQIIRQLEEEGGRRRSKEVLVKAPVGICNFLMNQKREHIAHIEATYGLSVRIEADPSLVPPDFSIEKFKTATRWVPEPSTPVISIDTSDMPDFEEEEPVVEETPEAVASDEDEGGSKKKRRRRRRRRGGGSEEDQGDETQSAGEESDEAQAEGDDAGSDEAEEAGSDEAQKPGRSRRRRSRRRSKSSEEKSEGEGEANADEASGGAAAAEAEAPAVAEGSEAEEQAPVSEAVETEVASEEAAPVEATVSEEAQAEEVPTEDTPVETAETPEAEEFVPVAEPVAEATEELEPAAEEPVEAAEVEEAKVAMEEVAPEPKPEEPPKPKRRGWWSVGR